MCASFDKILSFPLSSFASVINFVRRIRIDAWWLVWRFIFPVFTTLFLLITFLNDYLDNDVSGSGSSCALSFPFICGQMVIFSFTFCCGEMLKRSFPFFCGKMMKYSFPFCCGEMVKCLFRFCYGEMLFSVFLWWNDEMIFDLCCLCQWLSPHRNIFLLKILNFFYSSNSFKKYSSCLFLFQSFCLL